MRTFVRSKVTLLFMVLGLLIAVPAVAYAADNLLVDSDQVTAGDNLSRNLGKLAPGATFTADPSATPPVPPSNVNFTLDCSGNNHLNAGETADLNVIATSKKDAANNTITGGSVSATDLNNFSGPTSWPTDGSGGSACNSFDANASLGTSNVTIVAPKKAGTYTYTVTYQLHRDTGTDPNEIVLTNAQRDGGGALQDNVTVSFTFTVDNVAPANVTITGDAAATEGNTKTYTVSGTDANEDALTYGLVQDSGTGTTTITPSKDANNVVIPGSFDVKFLTAGSVFLKASANDGTATSFSALTNVTVASANTAPVVSVTGVTEGSSYEVGSVPNIGCSVTDAEDTGESAAPVFDNSGLTNGLGAVKVTCSYTDAGNLSESDEVNYTIIDTGDPVVTRVSDSPSSANGSNGWYTSKVTTTFSARDYDANGNAGAGFSGKTNPYTITVDSGTSEGSVTNNSGTVFDVAGNESNNASSGPFNIDLSKPHDVNFVGGPSNGTSYAFGSVPAAPTCTAVDDVSGIPTGGCVVTGYSSAVGPHTLTATATDRAGLQETATLTYTVDPWNATGFYSPVGTDHSDFVQAPDTLPTVNDTGIWNTVKGGSTVPLKFNVSVGGIEKTSTSGISLQAQKLSKCESDGIAVGDPVDFTTTDTTSLRYDTTAKQFIQNWKTSKVADTTCYRTAVTFADGSSIYGFFKLLK